jgi:hypothetical protein
MMDNFLTTLYYELFQLSQREKQLMNNTTWPDGDNGKMSNIRNDQSISEVRETSKILRRLIEAYLNEHNFTAK